MTITTYQRSTRSGLHLGSFNDGAAQVDLMEKERRECSSTIPRSLVLCDEAHRSEAAGGG